VEARVAGRLAEFRDVSAGDERPPGARQHDRVGAAVRDGLTHPIAQTKPDAVAEGVDGRIVHGEDGHAASAIEID
jgi:hypothetical protein